jgi:hypothetical protein
MDLFRARMLLSMCAVVVPTAPTDPTMDQAGQAVLCHHHNMQRRLGLVLKVNTPEAIGKARPMRWEVSIKRCAQIHAAAALRLDVKSGLDVRGTMRNGRTTEAVAMARASEVSQDRNKSVALIVSVAIREAATERAADGTVNEKASAQVVKEESDRVVSAARGANPANPANPAKASLTAAPAMRVARQDQDGKSAIDAAEEEVEVLATMCESDPVSLRTSRTAT